ncbi:MULTISPECIES: antibiotic biosynthesis monooxygenase [unclassified Spirosoma]|uniref:antibiotic biosynthesis monooxygenase family protein n=1 Tax=unclassified Spirosoma TaxID=2621999 RepID=UPI0009654F72|nr:MULTISPECIES: antibiotic biosynthesis monooxygenase [unclassified Spirosoma]MBN8824970.1 antibiotic biosynthesis monooxygenase [Spirosoma sp.]OJW73267.1 MAG: antibiotic biosynthesis monooxygenase [Spirosoma sp. 48-14]
MNPFIAQTPEPPYYVVVFTIVPSADLEGYEAMGGKMVELASQQPGFLGLEYGASEIELTISYWDTLEAISQWRQNAEHTLARDLGREKWFQAFKVRIAKVERDYEFSKSEE